MRRRSRRTTLWRSLVSSVLLFLAGCGGSGDQNHSTTTQTRSLTLQLARAPQATGTSRHASAAGAEGRQIQRGEAGFVERLEVRLQAAGTDLLAPQSFPLDDSQQETATVDLRLPTVLPPAFEVIVSAFNNFNNLQREIFRGQAVVQHSQESVTIPLRRQALVPVPATPAALQQTAFGFVDGAAFGVTGPFTLTAGSFVGNTGDFILSADTFLASGQVTIGSCIFQVTASTFPPGQGPQAGHRVVLDPCQVDALDRRLIITDATVSSTQTSAPPVAVVPTSDLLLPTPSPTLRANANASGTILLDVGVLGQRPSRLSFAVTTFPRNGQASVDAIGLLTYQPQLGFQGDDSLVVTVTLLFTDGNTPPLVFGTVPVAIAVRAVLSPLQPLADQTGQEGTPVNLRALVQGRSPVPFTFSAIGLPPGISIDTTTGEISGIIAPGAAANSPFQVSVTASDGVNQQRGTFRFIVLPLPANRPPALVTPGPQRSTVNDVVSLPLGATDPDGHSLTFGATNLPPGLALDAATGLISGTIAANAVAGSPFTVTLTVTDTGTPPLSTSGTFVWTVVPANRPPALLIPGPQRSLVGDVVALQLSATDPDGHSLTFGATNLPPGLALDAATGLIRGTIAANAVTGSPFTVTLTVTDTGTPPLSASGTFVWTVVSANRPPALVIPGPQRNIINDMVALQITATDPDGPSLTFGATNLPPGLALDAATGLIRGTIAASAVTGSPFTVTLTVTDTGTPPLSASGTFVWTVAAFPPLTIALVPLPQTAPSGSMVDVTVLLNAGTTNIVSYLFELTFNQNVVEVLTITGSSPFDTPVTNVETFASGSVLFAANNAAFEPANGPLVLATITFLVVGTPGETTNLTLRFPAQGVLVDETFQAVGGLTFINGVVTVGN